MLGLHVKPCTVQVSAQDAPWVPRKYSGAMVGDGDAVILIEGENERLDVAEDVNDVDGVNDLSSQSAPGQAHRKHGTVESSLAHLQ